MSVSAHVATVRREGGLPGGPVFRWYCSCGRVGSSLSDNALQTQYAGDSHARAKNKEAAAALVVSEVVRSAAALMRVRATAAYPGPWISDEDENCWRLHSKSDPHFPSLQILKAAKRNTPYAEYWPDEANGAHIVSWHPGVALAVAELLESCAGGGGGACEGAYRVACAYLGGGFDV